MSALTWLLGGTPTGDLSWTTSQGVVLAAGFAALIAWFLAIFSFF